MIEMAEFVPITTQAEFDAAIGERLKRERESLAKKYSDYDGLKAKVESYEQQIGRMTQAADEAAQKYAGFDRQMADMQAKIKGYETASVKTRIAHEIGLPYELAGRLSGDDEDAIRKDAEALSKLVGERRPPRTPPLRDSEPPEKDGKKAAMRALLEKIKED